VKFLVQYFAHSFITCQVRPLRVMSTREMNAFSNETCLNIKYQHFIFQHITHIYSNTYCQTICEKCDCCDRCISRQNNSSARSFIIDNAFSSTSKHIQNGKY